MVARWLRDGWGQGPPPFDLLEQDPLLEHDYPGTEEELDSLTQHW